MSLISLVLVLVVVGVALWLLNNYGAQVMDAKIVKIINIVVIIAVVIWLIGVLFGGWGRIDQIKVPRL